MLKEKAGKKSARTRRSSKKADATAPIAEKVKAPKAEEAPKVEEAKAETAADETAE